MSLVLAQMAMSAKSPNQVQNVAESAVVAEATALDLRLLARKSFPCRTTLLFDNQSTIDPKSFRTGHIGSHPHPAEALQSIPADSYSSKKMRPINTSTNHSFPTLLHANPRSPSPPMHRGLLNCLITISATFLLQLSVSAGTYHVSKTGNDRNPGTATSPWLTVQKAAQTMVAGDTVLIAAGTYSERVRQTRSGNLNAPIVFKASGYVAGHINTAVVLGGFIISGAYVKVSGMKLNGAGCFAYHGALRFESGGSHCEIRDVEIECTAGGSNGLGSDLSAISMTMVAPLVSDNVFSGLRILNPWYIGATLVGNNHILENSFFGGTARSAAETDAVRPLGDDIIVRNCEFRGWTNAEGSVAHLDIVQSFSTAATLNCHRFLFENNLVIDCPTAQIGMFEDQALDDSVRHLTFRNNLFIDVGYALQTAAKDTYFYNNTFYRCGRNTGHPIFFIAGSTYGSGDNGKVFNNIFVECGRDPTDPIQGWYGIQAGVSNIQADNNLVIGSGSGTSKRGFQARGRESHGINGQDPRFVSVALRNLRVQAESPCIGAAHPFRDLFTKDFANNERGILWDIGAFQSSSPAAPTGLKAQPVSPP